MIRVHVALGAARAGAEVGLEETEVVEIHHAVAVGVSGEAEVQG